MFFVPQPSTCDKCGYKRPVSQDDNPVGHMTSKGIPCPSCFAKMIEQFCGHMQPDLTPKDRP